MEGSVVKGLDVPDGSPDVILPVSVLGLLFSPHFVYMMERGAD